MLPQRAFVASPKAIESPTTDWTLTPESFELLLKQLHDDQDEAARRYLSVYGKLMRYFDWRGCRMPDFYADETMTRIARRLEQGAAITNFHGFMFGVAKKVAIEALRDQEKEQKILSCLSQAETNHGCVYEESLFERLEAGLLKLTPDSRRLLISYYATGDDKNMTLRRELAQRQGISVNALRVRVHRLKSLLEAYIAAGVENGAQSNSTPAHDTNAQPARPSATLYAV